MTTKRFYIVGVWLVSTFFLCLSQQVVYAQDSEVGLWIGGATYFGDLNPEYNVLQTRPAFGAIYRYNANPYVVLKGGLSAGRIQHADSISAYPFQQSRNLSFRSNIVEAHGGVELNFQRFILGSEKNYFTPYLSAGVGLFYSNPKAQFQGEWFNLRELGTEGQLTDLIPAKQYKPLQFSFPIGLGFKYWLRDTWNFYTEISYRFTTTDYVDDVSTNYVDSFLLGDGTTNGALADRSGEVGAPLGVEGKQRGDIVSNDQFMFVQIGLTYVIFNRKCPTGQGKRKFDFNE